jgi:hypothetical protein
MANGVPNHGTQYRRGFQLFTLITSFRQWEPSSKKDNSTPFSPQNRISLKQKTYKVKLHRHGI